MPNRIIKESIRMSDTLASVSSHAERLFWRIVTSADDYGRFDARPNIVLGQCMSSFLGQVTTAEVAEWLNELADAELIEMYESDGREYLLLTKWDKHQRTRAKESKFPPPADIRGIRLSIDSKRGQASSNVVSNVNVFENVNENVLKDNGRLPTTEHDLNDGEQDEQIDLQLHVKSAPPKEAPTYTDDFAAFWRVYPRPVKKRLAFKNWNSRINKDGAFPAELIDAAKRYADSCKTKRTEEEFVMHPATFLGSSRPYEDYMRDGDETEHAPKQRIQEETENDRIHDEMMKQRWADFYASRGIEPE